MIQTFSWDHVYFLLRGATWTLSLSIISFLVGGAVALLLAPLRVLGPSPVRASISVYVQLVQATPLLIVVFLAFYGLSFLNIHLPPLFAAGISLSIYSSAFLIEIWRGCIQAIGRPQWEAGDALALSLVQQLRYIILPQAFRIAIPPTVGFMVQVVKNTSVVALIGFVELTRAGQLLNNITFQPFAVFLTVAAIYFCVCFPLSLTSKYLSWRINVAHR
jgi:polar amino acid transport system permease protein